jgi:polysaccharide biosynthesis transport protein
MFQHADVARFRTGTAGAEGVLHQAGRLPVAAIDFASLWAIIRRRKRIIIYSMIAALLCAIVFVLTVTPHYTAVTQVFIHPTNLQIVKDELTPATQTSDAGAAQVESQARVISSDNVLGRVVAIEHLEQDPEFGGKATSLIRTLEFGILSPLGLKRFATNANPTLTALYELRRHIQVKRTERTYIVDISVTAKSPVKAANIANAIAEAYIAERKAATSDAARQTSEALVARLRELRERVRKDEDKVEAYKANHDIVGASGTLVSEQQLSELNNQLSAAHARTTEARARYEQFRTVLNSGADVDAISEVIQSPTISALRTQLADVIRRRAELMTQLGPRHPTVVEIQSQAQALRSQIKEEAKRIAQAARNAYDRSRANEAALTHNLETLKQNNLKMNKAFVALRELSREAQTSRAIYEAFLARSRETGELERLNPSNIRVISKAEPPLRRSWPPRNLIVMLSALMLGAAAGVGLAFVRELTDDRIWSPNTVRELTGRPLLAALPADAMARQATAFADPQSRIAAAARNLLYNLRIDPRRSRGQSVLVVGSHDDAETTLVALNLAAVAARTQTVLVVDGDVQRHTISAILDKPTEAGLADVAVGRISLSNAVVRDQKTNISVLPLISPKTRRLRQLSFEDIGDAFDETKRFDLIIVAATVRDADLSVPMFSELVDHIVLVIKSGETRRDDVSNALFALGAGARKLRGGVLTNADSSLA